MSSFSQVSKEICSDGYALLLFVCGVASLSLATVTTAAVVATDSVDARACVLPVLGVLGLGLVRSAIGSVAPFDRACRARERRAIRSTLG